MRIGYLVRLESFWMGVHYSSHNRRFCINIIPCVTLWVCLKGGITPEETQNGHTKCI